MYARTATFGGQAGRLDEATAVNRRRIEAALKAPPPGLEGITEVWMLIDREAGTTMDLMLVDTEEDLRRADAALTAMSPADVEGPRTSVRLYEVAFRIARGRDGAGG